MAVAILQKLSQAANPKLALLNEVGDLSDTQIMGNRVLVAIYIGPEKTKGGIIRTTTALKEDVYQGAVGLVLRLGETAFQDEPETKTYFYDQKASVGQWVVFRPGDGKRIQLNGVDCRMIEDTLIDMIIDDPELVTQR